MAIDQAFATPVSKGEEAEYIPTQIIAELFKSRNFDGIVYKSLLREDGYNLVLFKLDDASLVHCAIYKAVSVSFEFQKGAAEYYSASE